MEMSTLSEAQYHQNIFEMIGRNLKAQGYTKEQLHQYKSRPGQRDAMKRLHQTNAA